MDASIAIAICEKYGLEVELDSYAKRSGGNEGEYIVHLLTRINGQRQTCRHDLATLVFRAERIQREGGYFPFKKSAVHNS